MIDRLLVIDDVREQEEIWQFYEEVFRPINERTPVKQTFSKGDFLAFLTNSKVVKFIVKESDELVGLGLISNQLGLDSWFSLPYFEKHFPGKPIFNIMVLAVRPDRRGHDLAISLLRAMINEVPANGMGVFTHSQRANHFLPRFTEKAGSGRIEGKELDAEALCVYWWKDGKKVQL